MVNEIQSKALSGKGAHLSARRALEGLNVDVTGRKVINTPYTIWQLLKHISYWQNFWMRILDGEEPKEDAGWQLGWVEQSNAESQEELDQEVSNLLASIKKLKTSLQSEEQIPILANEYYSSSNDIIQAMASHLSYHIGELVLLRRIFGAWPPPQGGYVW